MASDAQFIYDGTCGFCTASAHWMQRALKLRGALIPWQGADLDAVGLTPVDAAREAWYIDSNGNHGGATGVATWLTTGSTVPAAVGRMLQLPIIRVLAAAAYRIIARNRHRIPGPWTRSCDLGTGNSSNGTAAPSDQRAAPPLGPADLREHSGERVGQ
jgi:predicted DCC family thiol-disulfide oxidoreductase YuxK